MSAMKSTARVLAVPNVERKFASTTGLSILRVFLMILLAGAIGLVNHVWNPPAFAQGRGMHWVGIWTTPAVAQGPGGTAATGFNNQTLRLIAHTTLGGQEVRVRLSNAFGTQPLAIGAAHVALRGEGAAIVPGSDRALTFGGAKSTTIWAGALAVSDPVKLNVPALTDLAVSIYLPGNVPPTFQITYHGGARQTNYVSNPGDFTASAELPVSTTKQSWYFLTGIEVMAPEQVGGGRCLWRLHHGCQHLDTGYESSVAGRTCPQACRSAPSDGCIERRYWRKPNSP
jgi:hypothetical protein